MPIEDRLNLLTIGVFGLGALVLFSLLRDRQPRFTGPGTPLLGPETQSLLSALPPTPLPPSCGCGA